ncbi:hypothetical protein LMG28727_03473 [Paraburkholderia kirstenboschensis]|uniref:DUF3772 domain-containing protein n=1 Tax=Paraburkholderia kirstenboschensis TaxID=1245436 RepID=UPI00191B2BBA|nr:DUF3772 domain-containing protein [Paraburkholderia kirstenboschensis]CAD6537575.1 hypothetical protein LMG28727_03473 [Paraburkholderia kirstenboschensis]
MSQISPVHTLRHLHVVRQVVAVILRLIALMMFGLASTALNAAALPPSSLDAPADVSPSIGGGPTALQTLNALQTRQDQIRQRASTATSDAQLFELDAQSRHVAEDVDRLITTSLEPDRAKTHAQLDVLGAAPASDSAAETPAVAQQRNVLAAEQLQLDAAIRQAATIKENLGKLSAQITRLLHDHLKDQLALRSDSIVSTAFWAPAFHPDTTDYQRLRDFNGQIQRQIQSTWQKGHRVVTALLVLFALAIATIGTRLLDRASERLCLHRLPEGRLRRSAMAISTVLASVATTICAVDLFYFALTRQQAMPATLQSFANELIKHVVTCALVVALGRALLSTRHPSWRLPSIADPVARALRPFPWILAALLLFSGAVEQLNRAIDTSLQITLFTRGVVALVVALTIGMSLLRANRVRSSLAAAGESPEARSTLAGIIHAAVSLAVGASLIALLCGYVSFARFLTYELVWFDLVLSSLYLLTKLAHDASESVFSPCYASGKTVGRLFGLQEVHLEQVATILSGVLRSALMLAAVIALLTGGLGTTPGDLIGSIVSVLGGERLHALNIVPAHIFSAIFTCALCLYLVRLVRKWLDTEFLPKTQMSSGMRASLLTVFSNVGYVLVALQTFSVLGVQWHNLAWIVSALSVGIGFGLQEIVKNFISGLILLAERPVKVGDMISITGIEGDIRRISVRATEIQLADRSTVIVPNSHLISQNVRNVTMGNKTQGVVTLSLTFALDIDPEQVRDVLLQAYLDHPSVLDRPTPSVTFSQLTPDGITLTATGYVASPRIAGDTRSDLLFAILKRLRASEIPLSISRTVVVRGTSDIISDQQLTGRNPGPAELRTLSAVIE